MKISENISKAVELEIKKYKKELDVKSVGYVLQSGDRVAKIYGLENIMSGEMIYFPRSKIYGMALNLEEYSVGAILFGDEVKEGDEAISTKKLMKIPVSSEMLGRVISPLGIPLDGKGDIKIEKEMDLEQEASPMFNRQKVSIPLETGIKFIDGMIPIGRGQRELIIGDRHTGKSSIAIDTIINQKDKDVISIYVAIAKKQSFVAQTVNRLKESGAMKNTIVISTISSDPAATQFISPYAGCAIAEYFMSQGKSVLIVYDDLSKHAVSYREISLLLRRPPGREAYPGDIFYIHSKLLERAVMLNDENGGGSITALPIVETFAGDVSAYIPTNIISITDGQIYLESNLFNSNIRPAINAGLSVSRVGGDAQVPSMKKVASKIKVELAQYREIESFSKLNSEMDDLTTNQIKKGRRIVEILKQDRESSISTSEQIVLFYAISNDLISNLDLDKVDEFESMVLNHMRTSDKKLSNKILINSLDEVSKDIDIFINKILKSFQPSKVEGDN